MSITNSISKLEEALNESFVGLVNESSDRILAGYVNGFTAAANGSVQYGGAPAEKLDKDGNNKIDAGEVLSDSTSIGATWLYVDPTIGNDTNASDSATSTGGWWYLVESDNSTVAGGNNLIYTEVDYVDADITTLGADGLVDFDFDAQSTASKNTPVKSTSTTATEHGVAAFTRKDKKLQDSTSAGTAYSHKDAKILNAKLYEITPKAMAVPEVVGTNTGTTKVVSVSFPFVNGNFELPGKELTNIFANAKISFQITFQALQAFFPFADSIDGCGTGTALAGTGKALNIVNAIPIYNEAFDYLAYLDS